MRTIVPKFVKSRADDDASCPAQFHVKLRAKMALRTVYLRLAKCRAVWESPRVAVNRQFNIRRGAGFVGACVCLACAVNSNYRVESIFTPASSNAAMVCRTASATRVVPELPVSDWVLGDLVVQCEKGCPRDYALTVLMQRAGERGATHVSSLSCVQRGQGWCCVGRASAPQLCDTES